MKILYYDCFCGISGDMNLGAMIDLGVDPEYLLMEISKLNLNTEYEIKIEKALKNGISGTKVDVILKNLQHENYDNHENHHDQGQMQVSMDEDGNSLAENHHHGESFHHDHPHDDHDHSHDDHDHPHDDHGHPHDDHDHINQAHEDSVNKENHHVTEHTHRNFADIENIINHSHLKEHIKKLSMDIFMKVAQAEAKVHHKPLEEVHFHEVGAIDSIIDIVGAAICLDYLQVDKIMASSVQVGGGFVKCAHGIIPVPGPATTEILRNIPIKTGIVQFETTTPTGAAILAATVEEFIDQMDFKIEKIGYGIGHRDLEIPNVLRVYFGCEEDREETEEQYIIETNIDDMNPELYEYVEEKLFANGALDVYKTPITMKKGRPATKLSILTNIKSERNILDVIFQETTSIGIRKYKVEKIMLHREIEQINTKYGKVRVKKSYYQGELVKSKPEYEDCKRIALEQNLTLLEVYNEVNQVSGQY
ncbi:MAG TPA: nickel pincer cofactor biosynthesis protein LarC [Mobilitalea sp.]|nr:nickel pincer cofactor biosynthesis protein LarC [Mobilitalea sp.]